MLVDNKMRVLVVEDEGIIARDMVLMLEQLGYEVAGQAGTAAEALQLAGNVCSDLVLMDIHLRGESDGVQTASEIRRQFGIPVVFVTSHADAETLRRAKQTQPYGYVVKPFVEADLRVAIELGFSRHQLQEELEQRRGWFEAAIESTSHALIATDTEGRISFLNSAAESLTGWRSNDAQHRQFGDIVRLQSGRDRIDSRDLENVFGDNEPVCFESAFVRHKDGGGCAVAGSLEPMRRPEAQWCTVLPSISKVFDNTISIVVK